MIPSLVQGTIGCTPNSVPMVFIVFSRDSWGYCNIPINTHYIPLYRAYIHRDFPGYIQLSPDWFLEWRTPTPSYLFHRAERKRFVSTSTYHFYITYRLYLTYFLSKYMKILHPSPLITRLLSSKQHHHPSIRSLIHNL